MDTYFLTSKLFWTIKLGLLCLLNNNIFAIDSSSSFPDDVIFSVIVFSGFINTSFSLLINLMKYILSCKELLVGASNCIISPN